MEIFAAILFMVLFVIGGLGLFIGVMTTAENGFDKYAGVTFLVSALFILAALAAGLWGNSLTSARVDRENANRQAVCLQIPEAEWIADLNSCIKDGQVINL
jgi:hypothetical protein